MTYVVMRAPDIIIVCIADTPTIIQLEWIGAQRKGPREFMMYIISSAMSVLVYLSCITVVAFVIIIDHHLIGICV